MQQPKRPAFPKISPTPAKRHYDHTQEEWSANPDSAPEWAKVGKAEVIGSSNSAGCKECEPYTQEAASVIKVYQDRLAEYNAAMVEYRAELKKEIAKMEEGEDEVSLKEHLQRIDEEEGRR